MIFHNYPTLSYKEKIATLRVISSGWIAQGAEVEKFENELCSYLNLPDGHAVAVSSGSAALFLSLWALEGRGKKIGLPVYACAALRNAVGLIGAEAVYFDCAKDNPNIDILNSDFTGLDVLIAPSMYGIPTNLPKNPKFRVVEDIAQAFGSSVSGEKIGLRGDIGICSFYATKIITTGGQGGAVVSRNKNVIEKVRDYLAFDCRDDVKLRFNFQMTDIQAAIGRSQLSSLPNFIKRRQHLFDEYLENGLPLLGASLEDEIVPVRYRAVVQVSEPSKLIERLAIAGVRAIVPIEKWELLDKSKAYPMAKKMTLSTVSLPIYPTLTLKQAKFIAKITKNIK